MKRLLLLLWIVALLGVQSKAEERLPGYIQAEKFTAEKLRTLLFSTQVQPHWMANGTSFWYSYKTSEGERWYIVNTSTRQQRELFDRDEMAAQLTEIVKDPYDALHLPIRKLKAKEDCRTFTFEVESSQDEPKLEKKDKKRGKKQMFYFSFDSQTRKLTQIGEDEKEPKRLNWGTISPDKKTVIYSKDLNLYKMSYEDYEKLRKNENDSTVNEIQLTFDGEKDFGWGMPGNTLNTDTLLNGKRRGIYGGTFSPDSRYFVALLEDERNVKDLWVINVMANPRPTLETYKYQMPGEKESPVVHMYIFDLTTGERKEIDTWRFKDQSLSINQKTREVKDAALDVRPSVWLGDNNRFFVTRSSRDLHRIDICTYTIGQDSLVPIIEERMNTYQEVKPLHALNNGKEIVQWSERDGWAHLYLYDDKGNLKNRITKGSWHVENIVKVDDKTRVVYFLACGMNKDENPYYDHLYRINLDGSGLKQLTKKDFFHEVTMTDDSRYCIDNYSRVNTVPTAELIDVSTGAKVMTLQTSDFSQLFAAGYKFPEIFKVKAADGITDLWGTMYKPFDFDSTKVYPIIDYVYPGPQVEATYYPFTRMSPRTDRLAQAGFIVISVGQRGGHPSRSKWYHNYGYGNMRDYPLADHKYAIEQLAARHSFIDINKVGIHGHSGGGFMSTAAMCQYPDFFKVAVSCAGNHDNNIYNRWWSETHHGVKEEVNAEGDTTFVYKIETNPSIAKNLKGHLLLIHGDIDNNVHPGNTIRVVNALIRAGKRFDMLVLPQQRHHFGEMDEYFYWRLVDYFSEHLLGNSEHSIDIPKR